jgi:hypothetical protein
VVFPPPLNLTSTEGIARVRGECKWTCVYLLVK